MWSSVVEETGEPGENHRTWMGNHYPATCLDPDLNPDCIGDKQVHYPLCYPGPYFILFQYYIRNSEIFVVFSGFYVCITSKVFTSEVRKPFSCCECILARSPPCNIQYFLALYHVFLLSVPYLGLMK